MLKVIGLDLSASCTGIAVVEYDEGKPVEVATFKMGHGSVVTNEGSMKDPLKSYNAVIARIEALQQEHRDVHHWCIESPVPTGQMTGLLAPLYWLVVRKLQETKQKVVAIDNTRLASLMLRARKKNKRQVVDKFLEEATWNAKKRLKVDIIEAYYVAYYGTRCVQAIECRVGKKSVDWLREDEKRIFLSDKKGARGTPVSVVSLPREYWFDFSDTGEWRNSWGLELMVSCDKVK